MTHVHVGHVSHLVKYGLKYGGECHNRISAPAVRRLVWLPEVNGIHVAMEQTGDPLVHNKTS